MDTYTGGVRRLEVDSLDDEIYYREMIGCTAKAEGAGTCATVTCRDGAYSICQKPGVVDTRWEAKTSCGGYLCQDAC
jgi:hypothetical protein